jgi:hypothetical protein
MVWNISPMPVAPLLWTFHAIMLRDFIFFIFIIFFFNKAKISTPYENTVLPYCLNLFDFLAEAPVLGYPTLFSLFIIHGFLVIHPAAKFCAGKVLL